VQWAITFFARPRKKLIVNTIATNIENILFYLTFRLVMCHLQEKIVKYTSVPVVHRKLNLRFQGIRAISRIKDRYVLNNGSSKIE